MLWKYGPKSRASPERRTFNRTFIKQVSPGFSRLYFEEAAFHSSFKRDRRLTVNEPFVLLKLCGHLLCLSDLPIFVANPLLGWVCQSFAHLVKALLEGIVFGIHNLDRGSGVLSVFESPLA
jgi:hypothetical protein